MFHEDAIKSTCLVFFYATPLQQETLYERYKEHINKTPQEKKEAGEHTVYEAKDRMLIPGNIKGNVYIIGADIRKYATEGNKGIMGYLNSSISSNKYKGLYTSTGEPLQQQILKLAAVYKIRKIKLYNTHNHHAEKVIYNACHDAKRHELQHLYIEDNTTKNGNEN